MSRMSNSTIPAVPSAAAIHPSDDGPHPHHPTAHHSTMPQQMEPSNTGIGLLSPNHVLAAACQAYLVYATSRDVFQKPSSPNSTGAATRDPDRTARCLRGPRRADDQNATRLLAGRNYGSAAFLASGDRSRAISRTTSSPARPFMGRAIRAAEQFTPLFRDDGPAACTWSSLGIMTLSRSWREATSTVSTTPVEVAACTGIRHPSGSSFPAALSDRTHYTLLTDMSGPAPKSMYYAVSPR